LNPEGLTKGDVLPDGMWSACFPIKSASEETLKIVYGGDESRGIGYAGIAVEEFN